MKFSTLLWAVGGLIGPTNVVTFCGWSIYASAVCPGETGAALGSAFCGTLGLHLWRLAGELREQQLIERGFLYHGDRPEQIAQADGSSSK